MDPAAPSSALLTLDPIGIAHTPFTERSAAPRQTRAAEGVAGTIVLHPGRGFEFALDDLAGWDHLWVIFWFHLNTGWKPRVWPTRSDRSRGVFATRAPYRPNPLGLSVVRLERIEGLVLHVRDVDMVDGTPVLDLKPYVPWADAIPDARTGWLQPPADPVATDRPSDPRGDCTVTFAPLASEQLDWLRDVHAIDLGTALARTLALGTDPQPYRRIKRDGDAMRIAVKQWRARFRSAGAHVEVLSVASGYRDADLAGDDATRVVHRAFVARWGR